MLILNFLLKSVASFFTFALLARFIMQWARAPFRNPIGQFVITVTDWIVRPVRRIIPTAWGHDLPTLLLAWIVQAAYLSIVYFSSGLFEVQPRMIGLLGLVAAIETVEVACTLLTGVVIVGALLSWINPHAPIAPVINSIAGPLLRPFQRVIPLVGGIDISPIAFIFALQLVELALASLRGWMLGSMLMPI